MEILAFDLGASNGRVILGTYDGNILRLNEIHRFLNEPVFVHGRTYWDVLRLFHEIKVGLTICSSMGHKDIASIGISTWGVDYGLLDKDGILISNPFHYRDSRTQGMFEKLEGRMSREKMFFETGIQPMEINTVYQLASQLPPSSANKLLFMPDLIGYFLTGKKCCEKTILSTSQLFDVSNNKLSETVLNKIGINENLFCPIIESGTVLGTLTQEISSETGIKPTPVVSVTGHDTASAVIAVPFDSTKKSLFISCGTWSILGAELKKPLITKAAFKAGFSNELGFNGTTRFLKNTVGLWVVQQCRKKWMNEGQHVSYATLSRETAAAQISSYINPNDPSFFAPPDMPKAIKEYCKKSGQTVPRSRGEHLICALQGLAMEYRREVDLIEDVLRCSIDVLHIVGGGVKNGILCQLTANETVKKVIAGPVEASIAGNMIVQLIAIGEISDIKHGRKVIKDSFEFKTYLP